MSFIHTRVTSNADGQRIIVTIRCTTPDASCIGVNEAAVARFTSEANAVSQSVRRA